MDIVRIVALGIQLASITPQTGVNEPPVCAQENSTVLEAGMCFHFQSGVWLEDFGAAVSEPFVVTENGGERLSDVRRELIIID